jgi:hypothetical protein
LVVWQVQRRYTVLYRGPCVVVVVVVVAGFVGAAVVVGGGEAWAAAGRVRMDVTRGARAIATPAALN